MSEWTKTPRTDATHTALIRQSEAPGWIVGKAYIAMLDHARDLERELSSAEMARDDARASYQWALGALGAAYGDAHPDRAIEFYAAEIVKRAESAEARAQALGEAADTLLLMLDNKTAWLLTDDGPAITDAKDKLRALLKERGE